MKPFIDASSVDVCSDSSPRLQAKVFTDVPDVFAPPSDDASNTTSTHLGSLN